MPAGDLPIFSLAFPGIFQKSPAKEGFWQAPLPTWTKRNRNAKPVPAFPFDVAERKTAHPCRQAVLTWPFVGKAFVPQQNAFTAPHRDTPRISHEIGSGGFVLPIFPRNGRPANRVVLVRKHSLCVGRPPYKMDNTRFSPFCQWTWKKIGALCNFRKRKVWDLCNIFHKSRLESS